MDVHVRDLRYFVAVARELHFTRAAEILHVSQPALSKQIRALERQLRVTLFDREHGTVRLTRAGAALLPQAERMLESWDAATASLAKASDCTLVIGMHISPGRGLLPRVRALMVENCQTRSSSCATFLGTTRAQDSLTVRPTQRSCGCPSSNRRTGG